MSISDVFLSKYWMSVTIPCSLRLKTSRICSWPFPFLMSPSSCPTHPPWPSHPFRSSHPSRSTHLSRLLYSNKLDLTYYGGASCNDLFFPSIAALSIRPIVVIIPLIFLLVFFVLTLLFKDGILVRPDFFSTFFWTYLLDVLWLVHIAASLLFVVDAASILWFLTTCNWTILGDFCGTCLLICFDNRDGCV